MIIHELSVEKNLSAFKAGTRSQRVTDKPFLAIGLGGAGMDALAQLKKRAAEQLLPDDPQAVDPGYSNIRFLAVDTDHTELTRHLTDGDFTDREVLNIHYPNAHQQLPMLVMNPTVYNWVDTEAFRSLPHCSEHTGGLRQLGRVMLFLRLDSLYNRLCMLLNELHHTTPGAEPEIHLFAGLGGGTGGGCLADLCYLIKQIGHNWGIQIHITGYLFTPDVRLSRSNIHQDPALRDQNYANGYAALKELDYLMRLEQNRDLFTQQYPNGYRISTAEKPLDTCYLLSAFDEHGTLPANAYDKAMDTASAWALLYMTDVQPAVMGAPTVPGLLSSLRFFSRTDRPHGTGDPYHIPGFLETAPSAEEALQYLAHTYCERFDALTHDSGLAQDDVVRSTVEAGTLFAHALCDVRKQLPSLELAEDARQQIRADGQPPQGQLPSVWARSGNAWLSQCQQQMQNQLQLQFAAPTMDPTRLNPEIAADRVLRALRKTAVTPGYGPQCALRCLRDRENGLPAHISGIIRQLDNQLRCTHSSYSRTKDHLNQAAEEFFHASFLASRRCYEAYRDAANRLLLEELKIWYLEQLLPHLNRLLNHLVQIERGYLEPLCTAVESIRETFQRNNYILNTPVLRPDFRFPIVPVNARKPRLDALVHALEDQAVLEGLVSAIEKATLPTPGIAIHPDLPGCILDYFRQLFPTEATMELDRLLDEAFPLSIGNHLQTVSLTENNIILPLLNHAKPQLNTHPLHFDAGSQRLNLLLTPGPSIGWDSAQDFLNHNPHLQGIHSTVSAKDRLTALQLQTCVPLYALEITQHMQISYQQVQSTAYGKLLHLRSGDALDWARYLPEPIPASLTESGPSSRLRMLYGWAKDTCLVTNTPAPDGWALQLSGDLPMEDLDPESLYTNGRLNLPAHQQMIDTLNSRMDQAKCQTHPVPLAVYTGDPMHTDQVLLDYLSASPVLRAALEAEFEKAQKSAQLMDRLLAMEEEAKLEARDLQRYCELLFLGFLHFPMKLNDHRGVYCRFRKDDGTLVDHCFGQPGFRALYDGFLAYRSMTPDDPIKSQLNQMAEQALCQSQTMEDLCIVYDFLAQWSAELNHQLPPLLHQLPQDTRTAAQRFYDNLLRQAVSFKEWAPIWPNDTIRQATKPRIRYEETPW